MRELWPNEADWKPLFDKLTQLEPNEDPATVLGELNDAMALCSENVPPDPRIESMSNDDLNTIQAELRVLPRDELLSMLKNRTIPRNIESILVSGAQHRFQDMHSNDDSEGLVEAGPSQYLQLELDLLSKLLGVSTGLDNGIFLVRCMVGRQFSFIFYVTDHFIPSVAVNAIS